MSTRMGNLQEPTYLSAIPDTVDECSPQPVFCLKQLSINGLEILVELMRRDQGFEGGQPGRATTDDDDFHEVKGRTAVFCMWS